MGIIDSIKELIGGQISEQLSGPAQDALGGIQDQAGEHLGSFGDALNGFGDSLSGEGGDGGAE